MAHEGVSHRTKRAAPVPVNDKGVVIAYDENAPGYYRNALLIATIARPPRFADDPLWLELVSSLCRIAIRDIKKADPGYFSVPQDGVFVLDDFAGVTEADEARQAEAWRTIDRRLGAIHTVLPFLWDALVRAGVPVAGRPRPHRMGDAIRRTLEWEEWRLEELERRTGVRPSPRLPMGRESTSEKSFFTDVLRPARPVLHLVAAFDHVLEQLEVALREGASEALRDALTIDVRGPQAAYWMLEQVPEFADHVVKLAAVY